MSVRQRKTTLNTRSNSPSPLARIGAELEAQPQCSLPLSEEDLDILSELLLVAQQDLLATARMVEQKGAVAPALLESLRKYAERAADLRERIEAR